MEYQPYFDIDFDIAKICDTPYLKLNLTSEDAKQWLSQHLSYEDEWTEAPEDLMIAIPLSNFVAGYEIAAKEFGVLDSVKIQCVVCSPTFEQELFASHIEIWAPDDSASPAHEFYCVFSELKTHANFELTLSLDMLNLPQKEFASTQDLVDAFNQRTSQWLEEQS